MLWTYPLFSLGLISLAAPIMIHFLMKTRGVKIPFSTLRFFKKIQGTRDKKKIRHWLLLCLRTLILALLVAAFARPFQTADSSGAPPSAKSKRAVIIVLDQSASMRAAAQTGNSCWDEAVVTARQILEGLSSDDRVAIVGDAEEARIAAPWTSPAIALETLAQLQPTNEAGHLVDGLNLAVTLFQHTSAEFQQELILVSDLQKSSCQNLEAVTLPSSVQFEIKSTTADSQDSNLAITDLVREGLLGSVSRVSVQNFSSDSVQALPITLKVDQNTLPPVTVDVEKSASGSTTFPNSSLPPGWHDVKLELQKKDALALDNQFYAALYVPRPIKVMIIEPHVDEKIYRQCSYFVASALDPDLEAGDVASPFKPFALSTVSPEDAANALASDVPQVVILSPLSEVPQALGPALKNFVQQGGGLLVWAGDDFNLLGYNAAFSDFMPVRFSDLETNGDDLLKGNWHLNSSPKTDSTLFQIFQKPGHGDLTLAEFHERLKLDLSADAEVLETYDDQVPFLISGQHGQGKVLVINSSPDSHWSDWPRHKTFLPLVNQMALYVAGHEQENTFASGRSVQPTHNGNFALTSDHANESVQILQPDGKSIQAQTDSAGALRHLDLEQLGPYQIRNGRSETIEHFCVNFPIAESNLETFNTHEVVNMLHFRHELSHDFLPGSTDQMGRHEWWPYLMALLFPLLFLDLTWGNRART